MVLIAFSCSSFRVRWPDANLSRGYLIVSSKLEVPIAIAAADWMMIIMYMTQKIAEDYS